jgi:hypothetical protein
MPRKARYRGRCPSQKEGKRDTSAIRDKVTFGVEVETPPTRAFWMPC